MSRPTLNTIAKRCGVSESTVSRALTRPDMVNVAVRDKILATASQLGYHPNKLARGLATGRLGRIGLLLPDVANPFFTELLRSVHANAASDDKSSLLIVNTDEKQADEVGLIEGLLGEVDGVIIASPRAPSAALQGAIGDTPAVLINRPLRGRDAVLLDYRDALEQAADHLYDAGHRRIAMVRGPAGSWAAAQRSTALMQWAERRGLALIDLGPTPPTVDSGFAIVDQVIASGATAVIAYDDMAATGVITGLGASGRSVPGDVAIVGCDDTMLSRLLTPSITTVCPPYQSLGSTALKLLRARIADPDAPRVEVRLPCTLAIRQSSP